MILRVVDPLFNQLIIMNEDKFNPFLKPDRPEFLDYLWNLKICMDYRYIHIMCEDCKVDNTNTQNSVVGWYLGRVEANDRNEGVVEWFPDFPYGKMLRVGSSYVFEKKDE